jgi:queuine tRNA-ribosyltransferase
VKDIGKDTFIGLDVPLFMPDATLGAVRTLTTAQLEDTGTKMVVVNTLHLLLSLGTERMKKLGGIKKLMHWDGKVLSDSGGFQVYSLIHKNPKMGKITQYGAYFTSPRDGSKTLLTPEISIDMQIAIDSDVLVVLDDCHPNIESKKQTEASVELTTSWARRAKGHLFKKYPEKAEKKKLFAVIQGGTFPELRRKSAEDLIEIGFDGYGFGGWPIGEDGELLAELLEVVADVIPETTPAYAMGIGTPDDIRTCVELGYVLFDCVLPTRNARHGLLYTSEGEVRITRAEYAEDMEALDPECPCETCTNYTRAYLHHLFRSRESTGKTLATIHNLTYYSRLMRGEV